MATATLDWIKVSQSGDKFSALLRFAGIADGSLPKRWDTGTIAFSNGSVGTVETAAPELREGDTIVCISGSIDVPLTYREVVTASAVAGGVISRGEHENAAFSDAPVSNRAAWTSEGEIGFYAGRPEVPVGVTAADPSEIEGLREWWAPDLEEGYSDGDPIAALTGREGVANATPRGGADDPQSFVVDAFGEGLHGTAVRATSGNYYDQAWQTGTNLVEGSSETTVIAVYFIDQVTSGLVRLTDFGGNGASTSARDSCRRLCTQRDAFVFTRRATATERTTFINYAVAQHETGVTTSGPIRVGSPGPVTTPGSVVTGRFYEFSRALSDAEIKNAVAWLLDFYGEEYARDVHVRESGDDTTGDGSEAAPFATIGKAWTHLVDGLGEHIVLQRGETYPAFSISSSGSDKRWGLSEYEPIVIRAAGSGEMPEIIVSDTTTPFTSNAGGGDLNGCLHLVVAGVQIRCPTKIPPDSPLRKESDAAFDVAAGSQNKLMVAAGSPTEAVYLDFRIIDYALIGLGLCTIQSFGGSPAPFRESDVSFEAHCGVVAHAHGSGHTNPYFVSGGVRIVIDDLCMPNPGWEPVNEVEGDNIYSHGFYDQKMGRGWKEYDRIFIPRSGSHAFQMRSGGWGRRIMLADCSLGILVARTDTLLEDIWIEGGKSIAGAARGKMIEVSPIDRFRLRRAILRGKSYTSGVAAGVSLSPTLYVGGGDRDDTWWTPGITDGQITLDQVTFWHCTNSPIRTGVADPGESGDKQVIEPLTDYLEINLRRLLVVEDTDPAINAGLTAAELAGLAGTVEGNTWATAGLSTFATLADGSKTRAEVATLLGETDSQEIAPDGFAVAGDGRTLESYASAQGFSEDAEAGYTLVDALAFGMILDRIAGTHTAALQIENILDWLFAGYVPVDLDPADTGGLESGAVAYLNGEGLHGTVEIVPDSVTVAADGVTVTVVFPETVDLAGGAGMRFEVAGAVRGRSYDGDAPSTSHVFTLNSPVYQGQEVLHSYNASIGEATDSEGALLLSYSDVEATNNSTQQPPAASLNITQTTVTIVAAEVFDGEVVITKDGAPFLTLSEFVVTGSGPYSHTAEWEPDGPGLYTATATVGGVELTKSVVVASGTSEFEVSATPEGISISWPPPDDQVTYAFATSAGVDVEPGPSDWTLIDATIGECFLDRAFGTYAVWFSGDEGQSWEYVTTVIVQPPGADLDIGAGVVVEGLVGEPVSVPAPSVSGGARPYTFFVSSMEGLLATPTINRTTGALSNLVRQTAGEGVVVRSVRDSAGGEDSHDIVVEFSAPDFTASAWEIRASGKHLDVTLSPAAGTALRRAPRINALPTLVVGGSEVAVARPPLPARRLPDGSWRYTFPVGVPVAGGAVCVVNWSSEAVVSGPYSNAAVVGASVVNKSLRGPNEGPAGTGVSIGTTFERIFTPSNIDRTLQITTDAAIRVSIRPTPHADDEYAEQDAGSQLYAVGGCAGVYVRAETGTAAVSWIVTEAGGGD